SSSNACSATSERDPAIDARSVTIDVDQALIADPEVVRDLVPHRSSDSGGQAHGIGSVEAYERAAVDRDPVRQRACVVSSPACERDTLVKAEQAFAGGRLVLDDDRNVGHPRTEIVGNFLERLLDQGFEPGFQ